MTESKPSVNELTTKKKLLFGLSAIPDQMIYQGFILYVFTFYFAVVQIGTLAIWAGYIIWGLWNMINDPLLGSLSDRTQYKQKWGKRKLFIMIAVIPLAICMILLFTVPIVSAAKTIEFIYFIVIIMVFEFFYTLYSVNVNALFPEMFVTEDQRAQTNIFIKSLTVVGIILASLPTLILDPMAPKTGVAAPEDIAAIQTNYIIAGIILAVICIVFAFIFITRGIEEKEELDESFAKRPTFIESLKTTLKNRTFVKFAIANLMVWYVFNTLLTIFPLYFTHVIDIEPEILITLSLVLALVVAALALPLHRKLNQKLGTRNAFMVTLGLWVILLIPFIFLGSTDDILAVIITGIQGLALSGCLFYVDILIGDVIDDDAVTFGVKRSASYYGVNAFIHRISIILTISTIAIVFQGTEWSGGYTVSPGINVVIGLKLIIFLFPALGCCVSILFLKLFDLHGQKLLKMREELKKHPDLQ